ncbi:helix-turn-helix transcriptional regulator [Maritimibacter sp. UBA3975]|uniref:helix-turn-helix transcriptional regulator n=1 Tax=Maritimibacter sp. UBA3975 TaxID=1946833 RepID=UPI000C09FF4D|nr:helix-turn-helix transcriptional regulator [Maritimibacter sp. UBA3975]MAM62278.1 hypothetical protein [Maritimibacter sp.]|tara:strand:+ start:3627 stop:4343 length:717 start_codon:yes stop_codon:yes gene_type:complete
MVMPANHRRIAAASITSDLGCFVRVGHMATLTLSGQADFRSMAEAIAVATKADRLALVRLYDDAPEAEIIVDVGGVDSRKLNALVATAAEGEVGGLKTYSGEYFEKFTVLLGKSDGHADILFMACADPAVTELLASELAFLWSLRKKGLVSRMLGHVSDYDPRAVLPLLSHENHFDLTRAEARVCRSLADGLKPAEIARRLDCSMPTVRTHLRNIYAKTGLSGMMDVVHKLHADTALV